ncbi:MAG: thioredoxin family protein [Gemmatimonadales bacterium]
MLPLGSPAPPFKLPDTDGRDVSIHDFDGRRALLVMFICNHCPYVQHIRGKLAEVTAALMARSVGVVGINSNDPARYPDDAPARMAEERRKIGYRFPYLFDESQEVAKAYRAACTPDLFLFDARRRLAYRGQFDGSRPGTKEPVTGADLLAAAEAVLASRRPAHDQKPSVGCNIKWRPGNEPAYFGST